MSDNEEDQVKDHVPVAEREYDPNGNYFLAVFAFFLLGGIMIGAYPGLKNAWAGNEVDGDALSQAVSEVIERDAKRDAEKAAIAAHDRLNQKDSKADLKASDYSKILPGVVSIPAAKPDLTHTKTVAEATGSAANQTTSEYILGDDGMTPEMEAAFRVVSRGKATGVGRQDENVFREAAARIGYVPAGVDPNSIRTPGAALGSVGRIETGFAEVISGNLIAINGEMIRLQGARAPGADDICLNSDGAEYDCSSWSKAGLSTIVKGREMSCEITSDEHPEGGMIGWCNLHLSTVDRDLGVLAVSAGVLISDPNSDGFSPYDVYQREAQTAGYGVWSGKMKKRNQ